MDMSKINPKLMHMSKHRRDASIAAHLDDNLNRQYSLRSYRVIKGDTVRIMRGEYSGIEGKVESVNTIRGTLAIEGIQREKVKGGNVKVKIHSSNVLISNFNMDDKYRQTRLQRRESKESPKSPRKPKKQRTQRRSNKGKRK
jgi:large subunit ribosomal protein L24